MMPIIGDWQEEFGQQTAAEILQSPRQEEQVGQRKEEEESADELDVQQEVKAKGDKL